MKRFVVLLFLLVVASTATGEPRRKEQRVQLLVKHYQGIVEEHQRGQLVGSDPLDAQMTYYLRENEKLDISVVDPNPLLFTYTTAAGTPTPNASFAAAESFAKTLKGVVDFLKGKVQPGAQSGRRSLSGAERALHEAGFTEEFFDTFVTRVSSLQEKLEGTKDLVSKSARSFDDAKAVKAEVAGWNALLSDFEKDFVTIKKSEAALLNYYRTGAARRDAEQKAAEKKAAEADAAAQTAAAARNEKVKAKLTAAERQALEAAEKKVAEEERAKQNAAQPVSPATGENLTDTGTTGDTMPQTVLDVTAQGTGQGNAQGADANVPTAEEDLLHALNFAVHRVPEVRTGITTARDFMTVAAKIGEPLAFESVPFGFKQDQHPFLTITKVAASADAATASKLKEGKFTFNIEPGGVVNFEVEPAVLYSLVEKEDWSTEALTDGTHKIVRKSSGDINGFSLGAMLSVIPRRWSHFDFTPSFQFGISPVSDRFGIFAGPSFRIYDLFTIGGGIAYQQTERLDKSQHEDQLLPKADDLKIDIRPETGFYFTISVDLTP